MSPRGREGRPNQRAQLCCCHGKGGDRPPIWGDRAHTPLPDPGMKGP